MGVWIVILAVSILSALTGIIYLSATVSRFSIVEKLSGGRKWLKWAISFALVIIVFLILMETMSMTNAIIITLGTFVIRLFIGIIGFIVKKIRKKPFKTNWQGYATLILVIVYFTVGWFLAHHVWATQYELETHKEVGNLRVAMFADSHMGTTFDGKGFETHLEEIMKYEPDMLLIVGDYVDDSTGKDDMIYATNALGKLNLPYGVWYAIGNHDRGYNRAEEKEFTERELIKALEDNGIGILIDESTLIDDRFYLIGREDAYNSGRTPIQELKDDLDNTKYMIVMDHQPTDYDAEAAAGVDLVLSGHTHGGQLFPVNRVGDWFGINDRTYGYERRKLTDFIVTSGISSWEIPFKTGTKSEFVIIDIKEK